MPESLITRITEESQTLGGWHDICSADPEPEGLTDMVLGRLVPHTDEPAGQSEAGVGDCAPAPPEDALEDLVEELLEMRYEEHLARRALQELFESGALQGLEC
jgi:hypothetical protein